jgi:hypothetical protein
MFQDLIHLHQSAHQSHPLLVCVLTKIMTGDSVAVNNLQILFILVLLNLLVNLVTNGLTNSHN